MARVASFITPILLLAIAASAALSAQRVLSTDIGTAVAIGLAILLALLMVNAGLQQSQERQAGAERARDLATLERSVDRSLQTVVTRLTALEQERETPPGPEPVLAEVEALSGLVARLAAAVAALEGRVDRIAAGAAQATDGAAAVATAKSAGAASAKRLAEVRQAVDAGRLELYLQPIVTLPQRRVRFYEALSRLKDEAGEVILPAEFIPLAGGEGIMPRIDRQMLFKAVQVLRRISTRQREIGLFVNLSPETLGDPAFFGEFLDFVRSNRGLTSSLIFELSQEGLASLGPLEQEALGALVDLGFRLSLDRIADFRVDFQALAGRGFRYAKIAAEVLLHPAGPRGADIVPADLSNMLARHGIDLIADRIELERQVVDLLDYDLRFGQGELFAPPRPVRSDSAASAEEERAVS